MACRACQVNQVCRLKPRDGCQVTTASSSTPRARARRPGWAGGPLGVGVGDGEHGRQQGVSQLIAAQRRGRWVGARHPRSSELEVHGTRLPATRYLLQEHTQQGLVIGVVFVHLVPASTSPSPPAPTSATVPIVKGYERRSRRTGGGGPGGAVGSGRWSLNSDRNSPARMWSTDDRVTVGCAGEGVLRSRPSAHRLARATRAHWFRLERSARRKLVHVSYARRTRRYGVAVG